MKKDHQQRPLSREDRIWRIALLCCHTVRNAAYFEAHSKRVKQLMPDAEYWQTVDNNFLDMCVLEWTKLFGEWNGQHHWRQVIEDRDTFWKGLLKELVMKKPEFDQFRESVVEYRDRFVAHLDEDTTMNIPLLAPIRESTFYLYSYLFEYEKTALDAPILPGSIEGYEKLCRLTAEKIYTNRMDDK